ncbi:SPOR domain-containing protein [Dyella psychrodurans]|uniref:SPOR domain-containing protein n=1 Tax=Dyella psychrodurans TaxID=1927960 RepID=A0A370XC49_9GAMM|nr:SPOR domain-containing protein [Dyella psychrodurans]RDS85821.1 SPOR domain-containing protein [Dyella psychrodurans]
MNTRLLGAAVLVALAVLFVPMFFSSKTPSTGTDQSVSLAIPPAPDRDLQTKTMSLSGAAPASSTVAPATTAAPNANGMATVNTPQSSSTTSAPAIPTQTPQQPAQPAIPTVAPAAANVGSRPAIAPPSQPAVPALPPATAARGIYGVNLSAYAPEGANRLMQRVRALGYPAHGETIQRAGKTLTLVSAGPFETRAAAEAARLKISQSIQGVPARLESGAITPQGDEPAFNVAGPARAGAWAVQVAAMGSQSDALALRDKLRASGFDGFVDTVNAGGKRLWRVRAGPQTQRNDAVTLRDEIKAKLGLDGNIVSAN